ncbi:hypothetical protein BV22DRAFT_1120218 [Leucogyrophana mollusca]|uniref:Uncharacterized protein n=1 Tax=Leucogyrophana mollusca TaxID=85980 RepID=A0ACB8BFD2_9AGAM|nr:hypothetical protein BV22DRAFT_1120218 [Leucogyrophana mollusca]
MQQKKVQYSRYLHHRLRSLRGACHRSASERQETARGQEVYQANVITAHGPQSASDGFCLLGARAVCLGSFTMKIVAISRETNSSTPDDGHTFTIPASSRLLRGIRRHSSLIALSEGTACAGVFKSAYTGSCRTSRNPKTYSLLGDALPPLPSPFQHALRPAFRHRPEEHNRDEH